MESTRMTARMPRDFVVFLIGMRVNRWWRFDLWIPITFAMMRMMRELASRPESGFLGSETPGPSNPSMMVQYWESAEHLQAYARAKDGAHFPAWADFKRKVERTNAVGVWHETYVVRGGAHESVYVNMPPFGLGKVGELIPAHGAHATARGRLASTSRAPGQESAAISAERA
ncbi:MAG: DUF4188 domain-containing protein [Myxococcota bacterium]|nr:DUF4188 domain-containing protein [Myxococcota bacterium]